MAGTLRPRCARLRGRASGSRSAREDEQRDGRDEDDGQRDRADNVAEARLHRMLRDRKRAGWLTSSSYRAGGSLGSIGTCTGHDRTPSRPSTTGSCGWGSTRSPGPPAGRRPSIAVGRRPIVPSPQARDVRWSAHAGRVRREHERKKHEDQHDCEQHHRERPRGCGEEAREVGSHGLETPDAVILLRDSATNFRSRHHTTNRTDVLLFDVL